MKRNLISKRASYFLIAVSTVAAMAAAPPPDAKRQGAWQAIVPRLEQADSESAAAMKEQLGKLDAFFANCKKGAKNFADSVLGLEGKFEFVVSKGENLHRDAFDFLQGSSNGPDNPIPDRFAKFVDRQFRTHVLDPYWLERQAKDVVDNFAASLQGIEGRLLVDAKADLPDEALEVKLPPLKAMVPLGPVKEITAQAVDSCGRDAVVALGRIAFSWWAGNQVAAEVTPENASRAKKAVLGFLVGIATDMAINEGLRRVGLDPKETMAAEVGKALDRLHARIREGEGDWGEQVGGLFILGHGHPDAKVRAACLDAVSAIERNRDVGVRAQLLMLHRRRILARGEALHRQIFDGDGSLRFAVDPEKSDPGELIGFARQIVADLEGGKP